MNLEHWQQQRDLSDSALAKLLEVHPSLISHIKAGRRNWSPKLAEAVEILSGGKVNRLELLYPNSNNTKKFKSNNITIFSRLSKYFRRDHV